jgi:hypothetical protein
VFRYQTTIDVAAAPAKTMSYLCDVERQPEWQPDIRSCSWDESSPVDVGKTARQVLRLLGKEREATLTVDAYEPDRVIRFAKAIPFPIRFGWRLEQIGEATTRVVYEAEAEPRGAFRLLSPLIAPGVRKTMEKEIRTIKDRVESLPE